MNDKESEQSILERCKKGDKQAFEIIVKKYMKRAYFSALALTHSQDDALDLSQEAFVRAYKSMKNFNPEMKFFTWYYRILKNLFLNFRRDTSKIKNFTSEGYEVLELIEEPSDNVRELVEANDLHNILWENINQLEDSQREIIILKDFQDYSYKEISELLEIPIGTVMSRLFNARKNLKEKMCECIPFRERNI